MENLSVVMAGVSLAMSAYSLRLAHRADQTARSLPQEGRTAEAAAAVFAMFEEDRIYLTNRHRAQPDGRTSAPRHNHDRKQAAICLLVGQLSEADHQTLERLVATYEKAYGSPARLPAEDLANLAPLLQFLRQHAHRRPSGFFV